MIYKGKYKARALANNLISIGFVEIYSLTINHTSNIEDRSKGKPTLLLHDFACVWQAIENWW